MTVSTPDWLKQRGGELRESKNGQSWLLYFDGQLQYLVMPVPADGKFACRLTETINGRRLDGATTYPSLEDAARGGLEELRQKLGW
jgi:hypothetical protein